MANQDYHLQFFGPLKNEYVDWPEGSVSVYRITGDEIACRVIFKDQMDPRSEVIARHSWSGYLGSFKSLAEAVSAIENERVVPA